MCVCSMCVSPLLSSFLVDPLVSPQSSLSVGSDIDLSDTPTPTYPLRRSWDANQEGVGLEVRV